MTYIDQLIERGERVHLNASLHPLKLAYFNPAAEWLENFLNDLYPDTLNHLVQECGMPLADIRDAIEEDDRDAIPGTLQAIGGWLVIASVPGSQKTSTGAVMMHHWVGTHGVFWGQTQEAALEHAVKWAEALWGNND